MSLDFERISASPEEFKARQAAGIEARLRALEPRPKQYVYPFIVNVGDDAVKYIEFAGSGAMLVQIDVAADFLVRAPGSGHIRTGDASAYGQKVGGHAQYVMGAGGTPTGTSGIDTFLTVSGHTTLRRVYFNNRTGASSNYYVTVTNPCDATGEPVDVLSPFSI